MTNVMIKCWEKGKACVYVKRRGKPGRFIKVSYPIMKQITMLNNFKQVRDYDKRESI